MIELMQEALPELPQGVAVLISKYFEKVDWPSLLWLELIPKKSISQLLLLITNASVAFQLAYDVSRLMDGKEQGDLYADYWFNYVKSKVFQLALMLHCKVDVEDLAFTVYMLLDATCQMHYWQSQPAAASVIESENAPVSLDETRDEISELFGDLKQDMLSEMFLV